MDINISSKSFFKKLAVHAAEAYASRGTESPLYTVIAQILVVYGMTSPVHHNRALGCVPQPLLSDHNSYSRRIPDFSMVVNFNQSPTVPLNDPKYVKPRLAFWVEIKPLACKPKWNSDEARDIAKVGFPQHLLQMHEQGTFMLQNYPGSSHFGVLIIGVFFTVLRYSLSPSSTTTDSYSSDPHTPRKLSKRKRANSLEEMESDVMDSVIDWNPEPLYFCEPILREKMDSFSPAFVRALKDMTIHDPERFDMEIPFVPSFFNTVKIDDSSSDSTSTNDLNVAREYIESFRVYTLGRVQETYDALKEPESSPIKGSPYVPRGNFNIDDLPHRSPSKRRPSSSSSVRDELPCADEDSEALDSDEDSEESDEFGMSGEIRGGSS